VFCALGNLLSQASADHLANWLGQGKQRFEKVFGAAPGAGGAAAFHAAVDGIGATFVLMQTSLGLVGGYNPVSWSSNVNGGAFTINPNDALDLMLGIHYDQVVLAHAVLLV
jgi:hypothetical protein